MQIKNLTMSFGEQVIFNDVSLNIPNNEKIGVVGLIVDVNVVFS